MTSVADINTGVQPRAVARPWSVGERPDPGMGAARVGAAPAYGSQCATRSVQVIRIVSRLRVVRELPPEKWCRGRERVPPASLEKIRAPHGHVTQNAQGSMQCHDETRNPAGEGKVNFPPRPRVLGSVCMRSDGSGRVTATCRMRQARVVVRDLGPCRTCQPSQNPIVVRGILRRRSNNISPGKEVRNHGEHPQASAHDHRCRCRSGGSRGWHPPSGHHGRGRENATSGHLQVGVRVA